MATRYFDHGLKLTILKLLMSNILELKIVLVVVLICTFVWLELISQGHPTSILGKYLFGRQFEI